MNPTLLDEPDAALAMRQTELMERADSGNPFAMLVSALDRGHDPATLGDLIALVNAERARVAEVAFNTAMNTAQSLMPCIVKDGVNPFLKTRYAKLETVNSQVKPVAAQHGFSLSFSEEDSPKGTDWVRIVCDISHTGGHTRKRHLDLPLDGVGMKGGQNKSGPQAIGATLAYGRRYLTTLIFNLTIADEDLDGQAAASLDTITEAEQLEIMDLVNDKQVNLPRFLEWAEVKSVADILRVNLAKTLDTLNRKKAPGER